LGALETVSHKPILRLLRARLLLMTTPRRLIGELLRTALLVVGSGIMGERRSSRNAAIALLANTLATARRWLRSSLLSARFPARISILPSRLANACQGGLRWRDVSVYLAAQALVGWPQFSAAD
jgi:glycerol uptake facilitator-like aquaporin